MNAKLTMEPYGVGLLGTGKVLVGSTLHIEPNEDSPLPFQAPVLVRFQEPPVAGVPASGELFTSHPHLTGWMDGRRFELRFRDQLVARGEFAR